MYFLLLIGLFHFYDVQKILMIFLFKRYTVARNQQYWFCAKIPLEFKGKANIKLALIIQIGLNIQTDQKGICSMSLK